MSSASAAGLTYLGRSSACAAGAHLECGHVSYAVGPVPGHRAETRIWLCRCSCHAACPLARRKGEVPVTVWQQRCVCPGAEQARTAQDDPRELLPRYEDWWKTYESDQRLRSQARAEAFNAARGAASGKTRDEIRELYIAELRARGQEIPQESFLEATVDSLSGDLRAARRGIWKWVRHEFFPG